ncbi:MAG: 30S ribosomal protein S7 [Candidatus Thermoplasmatota archaeon]
MPHVVSDAKIFDRYDLTEVVVRDAGLLRYINLTPTISLHTGAKHANRAFGKARMNIVERLVNGMMRTEEFTGKKVKAYTTVRKAFDIMASKTKSNPVQLLVDALENAAPREEVTRLRYGGISVPKAVDVSPSRRLDIALRNLCQGAMKATYKSTKPVEQCLANEILLAAKKDMNSFAIAKKEEIERVAGSAR